MTAFTGTWERTGVVEFLEDAMIPLRLACTTPSGYLWMLSLWFRVRETGGGDEDDAATYLECATGRGADVVGYLREDPAVAFEVSTNEVPYRGVRGRGEVTIEPDPEKAVLKDLLERYLDGTDSRLARNLLAADREEVTLRIDPAKVYSWDFSDRMDEASRNR